MGHKICNSLKSLCTTRLNLAKTWRFIRRNKTGRAALFVPPNAESERVCLSLSRWWCEATERETVSELFWTTQDIVVFVMLSFLLQQYLQQCLCSCYHISDAIMSSSCVCFTELCCDWSELPTLTLQIIVTKFIMVERIHNFISTFAVCNFSN